MAVPFSENGGFTATQFFLFIPAISSSGPYIGIFDVTSFDDQNDASLYTYRMEDIQTGRVPTVRRVILVYRDLGVATITVGVQGVDDNGSVVTASQQVSIGTVAATGNLLTRFVDLSLTAFRPQLSLSRAAAGGPFSIISATLIGSVEQVSL